jgi:hypothetical protein
MQAERARGVESANYTERVIGTESTNLNERVRGRESTTPRERGRSFVAKLAARLLPFFVSFPY